MRSLLDVLRVVSAAVLIWTLAPLRWPRWRNMNAT